MAGLAFAWFFLISFLVVVTFAQDQLNVCLLGRHHKSAPSKEALAGDCADWSDNSCCTNATSVGISGNASSGTWLNFSWDHCPDKVLSPRCRKHFVRDLCFYECSANTGPWLVPDVKKIRNQRFLDVPLCQADCDSWYNDCKDDFTCTDNWSYNFEWRDGGNHCPAGSSCRTFREVFGSSKKFCETIFGGSFKYTFDSQPCMRLWFNSSLGNPNDRIARWKASVFGGNSSVKPCFSQIAGLWWILGLLCVLKL